MSLLCSVLCRRIVAVSWRETGSCYRLASHDGLPKHRVTPFNRFILKITRTINPVPNEVSFELMDKANSRFRIAMTTVLMVACVIGSAYSIKQGRKASEEHRDSIYQQNRDRYSKEHEKKQQ